MKIRKNIFDDIAFWILATVAFVMPAFFLPNSWASLALAKMTFFTIGTLLALCFFIIERVRQGSVSLPKSPIYIFFVAIPILYIVSSVFSLDAYRSVIGDGFDMYTLHAVSLCLIYTFLLANLVKTSGKAAAVAFLFSLSVFLVSLYQIVLVFAGDVFSLRVFGSASDTLAGSWNDLTALLVVSLGALLICLETIKLKRIISILLTICMLIPFFFFALSNITLDFYVYAMSISEAVGIISLLAFAYVFSMHRSRQKLSASENIDAPKKTSYVAFPSMLLMVVSILIVLFASPVGSFLSKQTNVSLLEEHLTWKASYLTASKTVLSNPILGSGPNTFPYDWNISKPAAINGTFFWNKDVDYGVGTIPTSLFTVGILGLIFWLAFYVFVILKVIKVLFPIERAGVALPIRMIIGFAVAFTFFLMMFSVPGQVVIFAHFLFLGLLLGLDTDKKRHKEISFDDTQRRYFVMTVLSILMIIGVIFWGWKAVSKVVAVYDAGVAINIEKDSDQALLFINKAIAQDPYPAEFYQIRARILLDKIAQIIALPASEQGAKSAEAQSYITGAINNMLLAEKLDPTNFRNRLATGRAFEYLGTINVPEALKQAALKYTSASELSPTNPMPFIFASGAYLSMKDATSAKDSLIKALNLKSDWSDSPQIGSLIKSMITVINKSNTSSATKLDTATTTATSTPKTTSKSKAVK